MNITIRLLLDQITVCNNYTNWIVLNYNYVLFN